MTQRSHNGSHRRAIAACTRGLWAKVKAWVSARWSDVRRVAIELWHGVRCAADFVFDVGALCWGLIFADADEFRLMREKFKAKYMVARLNERVLARELSRVLAA